MVLTRPADEPRRVWLDARPRDLARASITAGRARFPVDAAIWLCCEALSVIDSRHLDDALAAVLPTGDERVPDELRPWHDQLRRGSGWHEPQLPEITMPLALADEIVPAIVQEAVEVAGDHDRLSAVLRAERAAVSDGGRRLRDLLVAGAPAIRRSPAT